MTVKGDKELIKALDQLPRKVANKVQLSATRSGAVVIRKAIKDKAPVDTGTLKKSIVYRRARDRTTRFAIKFAIGPARKVFYAMFSEFGTSTQAATPFIRPGFDESGDDAFKKIGQQMWKGIVRETQKLRR